MIDVAFIALELFAAASHYATCRYIVMEYADGGDLAIKIKDWVRRDLGPIHCLKAIRHEMR